MALDVAGRRATRIAKVSSDVVWWLALLFSALIVTMFLLSPLLLKAGVNEVAVQVSVGEDGPGRTQQMSSGSPRASRVVLEERDTTHHLHFRATDWRMFVMINWVLLAPVAVALVGIHLLRSFLTDVLAAEVFTKRNANRLSRLGWLMIAVAALGPPLQYWRSWIALRSMELETVSLSPAEPEWIDGSIMFGLLLLVLASAWRYGAELQQERDLTV